VWLITNPKPRIVETGPAVWDRLHFVNWRRYYSEEERDPFLQSKLDAEASGILNWLIAGCLVWQQTGLAPPESMRQDTREYQNEQDVIARFIEDEAIVGEKFTAPKKATYGIFKAWAEESGEHYTMAQQEFHKKMLGRFEEIRTNRGKFWTGFKLKRREQDFGEVLKSNATDEDEIIEAIN
jgi:putative DNA primase/helicase